jgi:uncharacterized membrane protein
VGGYLVVAAVAAVLLGLLLLGPDRDKVSPGRRRVLLGLRVAVILVLLLAMLRPERIVTETETRPATLVILVDRSRSMQVTDALAGKSRWEALRTLLRDASDQLGELADMDGLEIKVYQFDSGFDPVEFSAGTVALPDEPEGEQSAIGDALVEVMRREAGKRLVGLILLSDGAQRAYAPKDTPLLTAGRRVADAGVPLYTFAFGQARGLGQARDVSIADLLAAETVFVKSRLDVNGALRVDGYPNKDINVQLLFETKPGEMEVVSTTRLAAHGSGEQLPIELEYSPEMPGEFKLTLRAESQDGELVTTNNELSTFVTVLKGGLKVLYLEGALRVEQRFLQEALDASPDVSLDFVRFDPERRSKWPIKDWDRFEPGQYDVFILGDVDADVFSNEDWQALADRVDQGAGLIMLGGYHSFGPGGHYGTALFEVLPVVMDRLENQEFDEPIRRNLHVDGPVRMRPARLGGGHPVMFLAPGAGNERAWSELPPLEGINKFERLKPGATILAETVEAPNWPVLVQGTWGAGRVLAFAGDTTWRWRMEGHAREHKRFWRQIVLWLAKKDEKTDGNVWVNLRQRRFRPGSRVEFTVGATGPDGEPVAGAIFTADVILPDGAKRPLRLSRQGETMIGSFNETRTAGDYTIAVTATQAGAPLGEARSRFLVFEQDLELDNPAADLDGLKSLAHLTADFGGRSLAGEELPDLLTELASHPPELEIATEVRFTYWDTWPVLLLFVALVSVEWYLRKKWGLV